MKKNWKFEAVMFAAAIALFCVSTSYAQYGACEPAYEAPSCEAAPTCDAAPTCGFYAPSCDVSEPSCYSGASCGLGCGYGCNGCDPCGNFLDPCGIIGGALQVASSPFRWVVCALNDGVYHDCGCAPRPPKEDCDPCDVCGNYVGGCDEYSGYGGCEACGSCDSSYMAQTSVNSSYYDPEEYDSSPSRFQSPYQPKNNLEEIPAEAYRNSYSANHARAKIYNERGSLATKARRSQVRSVNYEQNRMRAAASKNMMDVKKTRARIERNVQERPNARIVADEVETMSEPVRGANGRSFGKTRPIK